MTSWRIGDPALCIDDQYLMSRGKMPDIDVGATYTIREIKAAVRDPGFLLFHFIEPVVLNLHGEEIWHAAWRFRPADEARAAAEDAEMAV